jgi:hypothetical protein
MKKEVLIIKSVFAILMRHRRLECVVVKGIPTVTVAVVVLFHIIRGLCISHVPFSPKAVLSSHILKFVIGIGSHLIFGSRIDLLRLLASGIPQNMFNPRSVADLFANRYEPRIFQGLCRDLKIHHRSFVWARGRGDELIVRLRATYTLRIVVPRIPTRMGERARGPQALQAATLQTVRPCLLLQARYLAPEAIHLVLQVSHLRH